MGFGRKEGYYMSLEEKILEEIIRLKGEFGGERGDGLGNMYLCGQIAGLTFVLRELNKK